MIFTTTQGYTLSAGTYNSYAIKQTVVFNTTSTMMGFYGMLSSSVHSTESFLSEVGFIMWDQHCVTTQVANVGAAAGASLGSVAAAFALGYSLFAAPNNTAQNVTQ